ncbi:MAG: hypothetical protein QOF97_791 [Acidimicrobiaceae bacterium]
MTTPAPLDPEYIAARRVLLNALSALANHGDAFIVVGAQAIYLHTGSADLDQTVAPYTTDGDLAVNPSLLGDDPVLEAAMTQAGFHLSPQPGGHIEPGIWIAQATIGDVPYEVPVDLIVPEGVATGGGRRGARLGTHGKRAARRAVGLEAALVDNVPISISALEPDDDRVITARVAGTAALFVAKAHKLHDRATAPTRDRLSDKDASDVFRLMLATQPAQVGQRLSELAEDSIAGEVTAAALPMLSEVFGRRGGLGVSMATRALQLAVPAARVEAVCTSYMREVLRVTEVS